MKPNTPLRSEIRLVSVVNRYDQLLYPMQHKQPTVAEVLLKTPQVLRPNAMALLSRPR